MGMSRILLAGLGFTALLATAAILALNLTSASGLATSASPAWIAAIIASACEAFALLVTAVLLAGVFQHGTGYGNGKPSRLWFALSLATSLLASAASIVLLVLMAQAANLPTTIFHVSSGDFLKGSCIALAFAFAGQLAFVVVRFVTRSPQHRGQAMSLHTNEEGHRTTPTLHRRNIKSVRYSQTKALSYMSPPGSSSGRSAAETVSSIRSSLSQAVRSTNASTSSKTRLISVSSRRSRSTRRPPSLDSLSYRERSSVTDEGFDSWDTSAVDPNNRQMILESYSPVKSRFLETIPASPAPSRSGSPARPGRSVDLEAPRSSRRSRSYSPVPRIHQERTLTPQASEGELHIHPLFRTDSPDPPPAATPGTIVVAAPNAGSTIVGKSVSRMRSGSLPQAPSPLSREHSFESFRTARSPGPREPLRPAAPEEEERNITPPIPAWILGAGSRTSLVEYQTRKLRDRSPSPERHVAE